MSIIQRRTRADLAAVAVSGLSKVWTAYTPTITAISGTFTTVSATGRYVTIGKTTLVQMAITITTNNTAAGYVIATLPNTSASNCLLAGREGNSTGKMLQGLTSAGNLLIFNYDNTYPGGSGFLLYVSGVYENA